MRWSPASSPVYPALLAILSLASAETSSSTRTVTSCTASSTSGAFFDLRPDAAVKPKPDGSRPSNSHNAPLTDYHVRGHDYGFNFTLNICNAVVDPIEDVKGIPSEKWTNISAYYHSGGEYYSLGTQSGDLMARGKELVLQYFHGSPCGLKDPWAKRSLSQRDTVHEGASYGGYGSDEDGSEWQSADGSSNPVSSASYDEEDVKLEKSTTIFFSCDSDATSTVVSFIGVDPYECNYVFKAKSPHACGGAEPHKPGSVGPGSVFAIILAIAFLVYVLGGVFYNRTVENARGWRQLPNYSLWSGLWSFICDMFVILTSSCARFLPSRRGYHYLAGNGNAPGGRISRDDENRLIDQYDEEWED
ncbi:mannose-6-phosphate receptor binding domain-containing protein [Xylariaceae sp. FL1272]|nr:mannose-6-phosphate receptor binding domain-containing protein [Xylariaceae sp. FL1272]